MLIILILGLAAALLAAAPSLVDPVARQARTLAALQDAKAALIGYASTYPDRISAEFGPGYLPCPDTDDDGGPEGDCSVAGNTTLGRLPWEYLGIGDLRDGNGERLWYALSQSFRYGPNKTIPLNSETPVGELSLDGAADIVALVIAPGPPMGAQDRLAGPNNPANYLEGANAVDDTLYTAVTSASANDLVVPITRTELMAVVERRVMGQVARALRDYRTQFDRYPALSRFAYPPLAAPILRGKATAGSSNQTLRDSGMDFTASGVNVQPGDLAWNVTDGSVGQVVTVGAAGNDSLAVSALYGGTTNTFSPDDHYQIHVAGLNLAGTAGAGSTGTLLRDTGKDFGDLEVHAGDVIENVTDGTVAAIASVAGSELTTLGTTVNFTSGVAYRIRRRFGTATAGTTTTPPSLQDTAQDFVRLGVTTGDAIANHGQDTLGTITGNITATQLDTTSDLDLAASEAYELGRFNGIAGASPVRRGLLPIHALNEPFRSGFSVTWDLTDTDHPVTVALAPTLTAHDANLKAAVRAPGVTTPDPIQVPYDQGVCLWTLAEVVECSGGVSLDFLGGTATGGSGPTTLEDTATDFSDLGGGWSVARGDLVENTTNPTGKCMDIVSSVAPQTAGLAGLTGGFAAGDEYRVYPATSILVGKPGGAEAGSGSGSLNQAGYFGGLSCNPLPVAPNCNPPPGAPTCIVVTEHDEIAVVTGVTPDTLTVSFVSGDIAVGEAYTVRSHFLDQRAYDFRLGLLGALTINDPSPATGRQRDITASDSSQTSSDIVVPDFVPATRVRARDFDRAGTKVGEAEVTLSTADPATGGLTVSGIQYDLAEGTGPRELPSWLLTNDWHRLIYVALAQDFAPGGDADCTNPTPTCLTLNDALHGVPPRSDIEALVIAAGRELTGQGRASNGAIGDYLEADNNNGDDTFELQAPSTTFNDQIHIVAP